MNMNRRSGSHRCAMAIHSSRTKPRATNRGVHSAYPLWRPRGLTCAGGGLPETNSAAAGNAVHPRCPFDLDVGDGLLGGGMQVVQALGAAALHLFDEDAAVGESNHAELADQVGRHRTLHIVVENVPAVEEWPQTVAADLDRDRVLDGVGRAAHFVEIWLCH